jgi:cardiolipin synthase
MELTIVATNDLWIGEGIRSFESVLSEILESVEKELIMTIYIINQDWIIEKIRFLIESGRKIHIYIYQSDQNKFWITQLKNIQHKYPKSLFLREISEYTLHAKVVIADKKRTLCGSANLTLSGTTSNYELGFFIVDSEIAQRINQILQRLN